MLMCKRSESIIPSIYVICPDVPFASGGVKQLYRHVDILNRHGVSSFIVHRRVGFRVSQFPNQTPIRYHREIFSELDHPSEESHQLRAYRLIKRCLSRCTTPSYAVEAARQLYRRVRTPDFAFGKNDILVIPEFYGIRISRAAPGLKKIIFNQNAHYTFSGYPVSESVPQSPYLSPEFLGTATVSEQNRQYLQYAFPRHHFRRIRYGFDTSIFYPSAEKKRQIAFMPRKLSHDVQQVINILKYRHSIKDFKLVPIDKVGERDVAATLRDSLIFLSFSHREGCPMPPTEAMACGCTVVGYHGFGGTEYFKPDICYPVPEGDVVGFAQSVERAIDALNRTPDEFHAMARRASAYVVEKYSMRNEEADVISFWKELAQIHELPLFAPPVPQSPIAFSDPHKHVPRLPFRSRSSALRDK